jgi:hypothetical protein
MDLGLLTRFIDHLQIVSTSNYNSLTGLHTQKITVIADLCVFISLFLVKNPNNVFVLLPYRLANIPQLTKL